MSVPVSMRLVSPTWSPEILNEFPRPPHLFARREHLLGNYALGFSCREKDGCSCCTDGKFASHRTPRRSSQTRWILRGLLDAESAAGNRQSGTRRCYPGCKCTGQTFRRVLRAASVSPRESAALRLSRTG